MIKLSSDRLLYKTLTVDDVNEKYVNWLNDPEVNRYLETRHVYQTIESCRSYVTKMQSSSTDNLFGIYLKKSGEYIGNIKLGFINPYHQRAQLSLFIGEKNCWGRGYAKEGIQTVTSWGFSDLDLEKIDAGCYEENLGSLRAFLSSGYQVEGFYRKAVLLDDRRIGSFWMSVLRGEFIGFSDD